MKNKKFSLTHTHTHTHTHTNKNETTRPPPTRQPERPQEKDRCKGLTKLPSLEFCG